MDLFLYVQKHQRIYLILSRSTNGFPCLFSRFSLLKHRALALQASFFIAYVVTSGWTSVSTELFRIIPLLGSLITKPCKSPEDEFEVPSFPYHRDVPRLLFFGLLGITYFFLAPLILPFLLIYFCLSYVIYRNQVSLISFFLLYGFFPVSR